MSEIINLKIIIKKSTDNNNSNMIHNLTNFLKTNWGKS